MIWQPLPPENILGIIPHVRRRVRRRRQAVQVEAGEALRAQTARKVPAERVDAALAAAGAPGVEGWAAAVLGARAFTALLGALAHAAAAPYVDIAGAGGLDEDWLFDLQNVHNRHG